MQLLMAAAAEQNKLHLNGHFPVTVKSPTAHHEGVCTQIKR